MTNPTTLAQMPPTERFDVVVIGGGQAGLAAGHHLARRGLRFVILDAGDRVGHVWRDRWDSLRVFTPAHFDALPGLPFPAPRNSFPSKDAVADYLETYAARHQLPIRTGHHVDELGPTEDGRAGYVVRVGERRFEADQVVVATGAHDRPYVPEFAHDLDPSIRQLHASAYRHPSQLQE
ncbi:MAG: FAD-dependent oxidoreductase, partial [Candidatus Limnocylindrales bacterium]